MWEYLFDYSVMQLEKEFLAPNEIDYTYSVGEKSCILRCKAPFDVIILLKRTEFPLFTKIKLFLCGKADTLNNDLVTDFEDFINTQTYRPLDIKKWTKIKKKK
jgi:hypothetical protein